jgi:hypothetical protein
MGLCDLGLEEWKKTKQRPPDVCAQEMGIEETVAARFGESISCCAFPRWTVWFTSILVAIGENGCPEDGLDWTIATRIKSYVC